MRVLRWLGVLTLLLAATGCVKVDQTLALNKNGSGTFEIRYGMAEQTIAQLEAMQQMSQAMGEEMEVEQDTPFEFDEARVRADFEENRVDGVELLAVDSEVVDGWKYMQIKLRFDSLEALAETSFFEDSGMSLSRDAAGNYVLTQRSGNGDALGAEEAGAAEMQQQMMAQMAAMFSGLRIVNRIETPTDIVESNATEVRGRQATWVFDVDEDPNVLTQLDNLDLRVVFKGRGLNLPEIEPAETVD
ncbi:MAG: hypothetical protein EA400_08010 [Chromatiaceae bacterium]|nr:MAG: hypothetical protein EA400_08010 [Chromatiaceae bacterium]